MDFEYQEVDVESEDPNDQEEDFEDMLKHIKKNPNEGSLTVN